MRRRVDALAQALGPVRLAGYSRHDLAGLTVIAARPHAMDGRWLSFSRYLAARFGISQLDESRQRLCRLVDGAPPDRAIVFLGHNGPAGLGHRGPWGLGRRDVGDPDLAAAVLHALASGRRVAAVVAGHVHHRDGESARRWWARRDGVLYVNPARVVDAGAGLGRAVRLTVSETRVDLVELRRSVTAG